MTQAAEPSRVGANVTSVRAAICIGLAFVTLLTYWGLQSNEFVNYDDYSYITQNPHVNAGLSLDGVRWAFTSSHSFNWHPLTWLSHMLDVELFGLNPAGHHWSSLLLHLCNTLLLFLLLHRMTGSFWRSGVVAALFSLHPLHVESVAWASERKDVLSAFFWMAATLAYAEYARSPGIQSYLLALLLFAFGLMSKPMVVTLPIVLLILDFWPLKRFREKERGRAVFLRLFREKIPFFALAAAACVITYLVQEGAGAVAFELPLKVRLFNALASYARYIFKMFWPLDLTCFYPHPVDTLETWRVAGSLLFLVLSTLFVVRLRRRRPFLLTGWLWYLVTLVPVIGLVQVGEQAMADRYTYIPLVGLFLMAGWTLPPLSGRGDLPKLAAGSLLLVLFLTLVSLSRRQVETWRDSHSLFQHEVEVNESSFLAHFHLALALEEKGRLQEASVQYAESVRIRPGFQLGFYHLGNVSMRMGRIEEALRHFSTASRLDPRDYRTRNNMGYLLLKEGRYRESAEWFSEALRINPEDPLAKGNLAHALRMIRESGNP
jgi:protein O-mannosyl-transferase